MIAHGLPMVGAGAVLDAVPLALTTILVIAAAALFLQLLRAQRSGR